MSQRLRFEDLESRDDAMTFASRASRLLDTAVRLQGAAGVLVMTAAPLAPRGLMDATPTVLGMRTVAIDPELECDVTVDAASLVAADDEPAIVLPESALRAAWAGISAPRAGWTPAGSLDAAVLAAQAHDGMARVAEALPSGAGEEIVQGIRARVWGERSDDVGGMPLGIAFAAVSLGFISGVETASVFTSGPWTRISLSRGHVLHRGPVVSGLTAVRGTGGPKG